MQLCLLLALFINNLFPFAYFLHNLIQFQTK